MINGIFIGAAIVALMPIWRKLWQERSYEGLAMLGLALIIIPAVGWLVGGN